MVFKFLEQRDDALIVFYERLQAMKHGSRSGSTEFSGFVPPEIRVVVNGSLVVPFPSSSSNPMPSLFSRSRTNSTPQKLHPEVQNGLGSLDEFGRVSSRISSRAGTLSTPSKKDKKREQKRSKTQPLAREDELVPDSLFPDGAFLPLNLERPRSDATLPEPPKEHDYGYLSYERHVVLGLEQAERLVEVISEELETRGGITTPFIFSTTALDISSSSIKRIIRSFLNTCEPLSGHRAQEAEAKWREEAQFAGPHELGMCLRWGLARVIRSVGGQDVRGLISWEHYVEFRDSEAGEFSWSGLLCLHDFCSTERVIMTILASDATWRSLNGNQ